MSKSPVLLLLLCLVVGTPSAGAASAASTSAASTSGAVVAVDRPGAADVALTATSARSRWTAPRGPFFNDPHVRKGQFRIERKLIETIRHARPGSIIRIGVYSFDRMPVARALVAAHKRGVRVQMLLNDHQYTKAMRVVRKRIGAKRSADSFIDRCTAGCRTTANRYNNLHSKFYLFSRAGRSRDVVAVGSHTLTLNAALHQWNDLYFSSGDHGLYRGFVDLFDDMALDHDTRRPARFFCGTPTGPVCDESVDKHTVWAYPRPSGPRNDLVLDTLDKVQCLTPTASGGQVRTRLALSMHTMRGRRGDYLARAIRTKYAEGCKVRVSYGLIGFHTKKVIGAPTKRGRIPLRSTGLDYNPDDNYDLNKDGKDDLILSFYSHQKYLTIQGTYDGVPNSHLVVTGSSNWASLSPGNDEIRMTIQGRRLARKYVRNFDHQWKKKRNTRNAYTTTYTTFRVPTMVRDADGTMRRTYVTERRKVTTIEPDGYRRGPYWEGD